MKMYAASPQATVGRHDGSVMSRNTMSCNVDNLKNIFGLRVKSLRLSIAILALFNTFWSKTWSGCFTSDVATRTYER